MPTTHLQFVAFMTHSGHRGTSFDHLVGAGEKRGRDRDMIDQCQRKLMSGTIADSRCRSKHPPRAFHRRLRGGRLSLSRSAAR